MFRRVLVAGLVAGVAACRADPGAADAALAVVPVSVPAVVDAGPGFSVWRVWDGGSEPWSAASVRPLLAPVSLRASFRDVPAASIQATVSNAQTGSPAEFQLSAAPGSSGGSVVQLTVSDLAASGRHAVLWRGPGPDGGLVALGTSEIELQAPPKPDPPPAPAAKKSKPQKPKKRRR